MCIYSGCNLGCLTKKQHNAWFARYNGRFYREFDKQNKKSPLIDYDALEKWTQEKENENIINIVKN